MGKTVREAVPERVIYFCDRCRLNNIDVDATIETMDRDFQGNIVYSHKWHLCRSCRSDFADWMKK